MLRIYRQQRFEYKRASKSTNITKTNKQTNKRKIQYNKDKQANEEKNKTIDYKIMRE